MNDPKQTIHELLSLTRTMAEARNLESALRAVCDSALALLPANHTSVRVLDDSRRHLLSGARSGAAADGKPMAFKRGSGVVGWVCEHGRPVCIADVSQDSRFVPRPGQELAIQSLLAVPLWAEGQVVGVLAASAKKIGAFSEDDSLLAQLLANCAIPAVERSRLLRLHRADAGLKAADQQAYAPLLAEELSRARADVQPFSLLHLELDELEALEERFGQPAAKAALVEFVFMLQDQVSYPETLARVGGETFALLLPNTDRRAARALAEHFRLVVADSPFVTAHHEPLNFTVSAGAVTWNQHESSEDLDGRAAAALTEAQTTGGNRTHP